MNQSQFAAALLNNKAPVPEGVVDPQGRPAGRRFDVYRNNVIVSLSKALAAAYPVVEKLVGPAFFGAMANVYVRANPPKTPLMIHYGAEFPDWVATFPPAASLPYLPDIARLERARRKTYHAADSQPADPALLGTLRDDELARARFHFLDAMHIVASPYPIFSIWKKNMDDPALILPKTGEIVLIARPVDDLEMRLITPQVATFLGHLLHTNLGDSLDKMDEDFDFASTLGGILSARLLTNITINPA